MLPNLNWTRRREQRRGCFGKLMGWRLADEHHRHHKGWLNDYSPSGLSFMVGTPGKPGLGSDVEVVLSRSAVQRRYHVVRIEALTGNLTMVACRKAPPAFHHNGPAPFTPLTERCRFNIGVMTTSAAAGKQLAVCTTGTRDAAVLSPGPRAAVA